VFNACSGCTSFGDYVLFILYTTLVFTDLNAHSVLSLSSISFYSTSVLFSPLHPLSPPSLTPPPPHTPPPLSIPLLLIPKPLLLTLLTDLLLLLFTLRPLLDLSTPSPLRSSVVVRPAKQRRHTTGAPPSISLTPPPTGANRISCSLGGRTM
jgi:hypothetical protein